MKKPGTVVLNTMILAGLAILLSACSSFGVRAPARGQEIELPATATSKSVPVEVAWTPANKMQNLKVVLEPLISSLPTPTYGPATDITSTFAVTASNATGNVSLPAGKYRLTASAEVYDGLYRRDIAHNYPVEFEIYETPRLAISLQPATLVLTPGTSVPVTVNVNRMGAASAAPAPVQVSVGNLPDNVTASGATIPATAASGTIMLTAAAFAERSSTIRIKAESSARGRTIIDAKSLSVRVGRAAGSFAPVAIQAVNAGATAASPNGNAVLSILANVPGYATAQLARFTRSGTQTVLMELGFNMGRLLSPTSSYGGAGFCAGASAGFAISGVNPNQGVVAATDFVVFAGRLDDASRQTAQLEVWAVRPPPLGQAATYAFAPQVWFTPDCLVMMVLSAQSSLSGGEKHLATFYDFSNRSLICAQPFDQLPTAPGFSARLLPGQNQDTIELRADGQTRICNVQ